MFGPVASPSSASRPAHPAGGSKPGFLSAKVRAWVILLRKTSGREAWSRNGIREAMVNGIRSECKGFWLGRRVQVGHVRQWEIWNCERTEEERGSWAP